MAYEDKTLVCEDCGQEFVHSAEDQARYAERGFTNDPKRCRECREKRKARQPDRGGRRGGYGGGGGGRSFGGEGRGRPQGRGGYGGGGRPPRESYEVICAACGATTTVPFKPAGDRPVYCRDCYRARKT